MFGWHQSPWINVFLKSISIISNEAKNILEIGASSTSAPSLLFLLSGSKVNVTCYPESNLAELQNFCETFCKKFDVHLPNYGVINAFNPPTNKKYDLIILKGVLGGLDRSHNQINFSSAIEACFSILQPNGTIMIMDKGNCTFIHNFILKNLGDAGKNSWHYFKQVELLNLTKGRPYKIYWAGFSSIGVMPFKSLQFFCDSVDKYFLNFFLKKRGVVFSLIIKN